MQGTAIFNHVGHCVSDVDRARRFYEGALGFSFWWSFDAPDEQAAAVLGIPPPLGLHAAYLVRDGLVLELLAYAEPAARRARAQREMSEPGLTHISVSVPDLASALALVEEHGGERLPDRETDAVAFVRDPDGQLIELSTMAWRDMLPPLP